MNNFNRHLIDVSPALVKEWDKEKNADLDVKTILATSEEIVWWKCEKGHEWQTKLVSRVKKDSACPYCVGHKAIIGVNDVATLYPELVAQFHPTKNGELKLSMFKESSAKKIWWRCEVGHEWEAVINTRTKRGYGCPVCSNQKIVSGINDLRTLFPKIAKEISITENEGINLDTLPSKGTQKIMWICPNGHHYEASIGKRTVRGDGCPYCSGKKPILGENDLGTIHPEIKKYWDEDMNGNISNYTRASGRIVSWKCENGHTWNNIISKQVNYNSCPYCDGRLLVKGINDVATVYPELASEWDIEANGKDASDVKASTSLYAFWKCIKGHTWKSNIDNRIKGKGCPYCSGKYPVKGENDLATLFSWLVKEWNFELNRKGPDEYLPKSNARVWWRCENEHTWKTTIAERTRGTKCPICFKERS